MREGTREGLVGELSNVPGGPPLTSLESLRARPEKEASRPRESNPGSLRSMGRGTRDAPNPGL